MPPGFPVRLQQLESSTISESSEFIGTLDAERGIVLRPETDGRITEIYVSSGDRVSAGEPILQLSPDRSQAEMSAALANVNVSRAARNNAEAQLRAAEAEQASANADVALQESEYRRTESLVNDGVLPEQNLDQVRRDRDAAIAALNAAQQQVGAARAAVDEASAALSQAEAQAAATQQDLLDTLVLAPIDGIVGDIPVKLGDYVSTGDVLTSITENSTLELDLEIPIERRDDLRIGLPVQLTRYDGDDLQITGRIQFISPEVNADTQSILAKVTFPNTDGRLQDSQRVEARVIWQEQPGVLVPATAIARIGGQTFVYVAVNNPEATEGMPNLMAQQRLVTLGGLQGNDYQVLDGLDVGDTIVVSGILNLADGMPIIPESDAPASDAPATMAP
jgi:RND family efflux transporter MFP subunit